MSYLQDSERFLRCSDDHLLDLLQSVDILIELVVNLLNILRVVILIDAIYYIFTLRFNLQSKVN